MIQPEKIKQVTPEQWNRLDQHCQEWLNMLDSRTPTDRAAVEGWINEYYQSCNLKAPEIFWCQSTWQMLIMPVVVFLLVNSKPVWASIDSLIDRVESGQWKSLWIQMKEQLGPARHERLGCSPVTIKSGPASMYESISMYDSLRNRKLAMLVNGCFDETAGPELRNRFDERYRNLINLAPWEILEADLFSRMSDDLKVQLHEGLGAPLAGDALMAASLIHSHWSPGITWWGLFSNLQRPLYEFIFKNFAIDLPSIGDYRRAIALWSGLARNALAYSFYEQFCFVSDRPTRTEQDERGRPHNENGAAFTFADGYEIYAWHGTAVPRWVIESPEKISVAKIQSELNTEIRRVLLERFGIGRFLKEAGADLVHTDEYGTLYLIQMFLEEEITAMVRVVNRTAEADGTHKEYFLRVPPNFVTARGAVAWTFGMREEEYNPIIET